MHSNVKEIVTSYLGKACKDASEISRISKHIEKKYKSEKDHNFTFIDLFAGIGGMRLGFESEGGKCVFSSEWDENAQKTYFCNFGEIPDGDITQIDEKAIPDHDVLLAGFPCQAFSVAGERKGFEDTRGTLFFDVARIIKHKQPSAFLLENVKGLLSHDKGNTFSVICSTLDQLGYEVKTQVLNTKDYGNTPQTRERIYIVGFNRNKVKKIDFSFPEKIKLTKTIHSCLEIEKQSEIYYYKKFDIYPLLKKSMKKTDTVYQWRRVYVRENKSNVCPTLTANMGTGGHNVPLVKDSYDIRKLTPRECARFQGFPDSYVIPSFMARSHLYKQFGNSVSVTVINRIAESMHKVLQANKAIKLNKKTSYQAPLPLENVL